MRALQNDATRAFVDFQHEVIGRWRSGELDQKAAQLEIEHFWAGALRRAVIDGDVEQGSVMAGQSVGMVKQIEPTADIIASLVAESRFRHRTARHVEPRLMTVPPADRGGDRGGDRGADRGADREAWRRLLRRVRDAMAAEAEAREQLDQVVQIIATEMVAEVCSVYARQRGGSLVLLSTEGLRSGAVLHTRLKPGEGLVGDVVERGRALALADAQAHPKFAYRPETGEEAYQSFLGVPIVRAGRVLGVLVVQNRTARLYREEETEALETVAMVVAELLAGSQITGLVDSSDGDETTSQPPARLPGTSYSPGLVIGDAVIHERGIAINRLVAEDSEAELERLATALQQMYRALDDLFEASDLGRGEHREVLDALRLVAHDRGWLDRIRDTIGQGLSAEAAVQRVQNETRVRFRKVRDPYIRERVHDMDDIANRLLQHLAEPEGGPDMRTLPESAIVVAREMGPAEILEYDRSRLAGLVIEEGSATAHAIVVARALEIPVVGRVSGALEAIHAGDRLIVDGDHSQVFRAAGPDDRSHLQVKHARACRAQGVLRRPEERAPRARSTASMSACWSTRAC